MTIYRYNAVLTILEHIISQLKHNPIQPAASDGVEIDLPLKFLINLDLDGSPQKQTLQQFTSVDTAPPL